MSDGTGGAGERASAAGRFRQVWVVIPLLVALAIATLFFFRLGSGDPSVIPSALLDRPVPEFSLPPLERLSRDGAPVPGLAAADLRSGEVTVVNVWASWCAPCRREHPLLMQIAATGVRVVGINYKDEAENARRFLGSLGNPYAAVGVDRKGRSAIDWGVYGVPETFIVDGAGVIREKHVGPLSEAALAGPLAQAIAQAAPD